MITMDDIIREGHPTLRKTAEQINFPLTEEIVQLGNELLQFLINSQNPEIAEEYGLRAGVGIAAPQVNVSKRLLAVHVPSADEESAEPEYSVIMVNPRIVSHSVQEMCLPDGEGCLSVDREVPGYVPRHKRITVDYYDLDGNKQKERLRGFPAIVVQHEIDHLNGVMFYDRIDSENPLALPDGIDLLGASDE